MSVENIDSLSTQGSSESKETMSNLHGKKENEEQQPFMPDELQSMLVPEGDFAPETKTVKAASTGIEAWLEELDEIGLLRILTLSDVPFLASVLALSSWSSRGQPDRTPVSIIEGSSLWLGQLSSSEIRSVQNRIADDFKSGAGILITSRWISSIQASIGENKPMASEVSPWNVCPENRIGKETDKDEGEMTDMEAFWFILEHVRAVFPGALSYISGAAAGSDNSTLLTLPPCIIRRLGPRKIFDALNIGLKSVLPKSEFLCSPDSTSNWVDDLLLAIEVDDRDQVQVPLFVVLLFRLDSAFREAYQASLATSMEGGAVCNPDLCQAPCTDGALCVPSGFANGLEKCIREFEDAALKDEEKKTITSELVKACGGADGRRIQLEELILTPLALVGRSIEPEGIGSLAAVDDIIKAALDRFRNAFAKKETASIMIEGEKPHDRTVAASDLIMRRPSQPPGTFPSSQKTNTKKKKRRKPKKRSKGRAFDQSKAEGSAHQTVASDVVVGTSDYNIFAIDDGRAVLAEPSEADIEPLELVHESNTEIRGFIDTRSITSEVSIETSSIAGPRGNSVLRKEDEAQKTTDEIRAPSSSSAPHSSQQKDDHHDDGDAWETVEVKPRYQRKKTLDRSNTMSSRNSTNTASGATEGSQRRSKEKRTPASRKKNATRKMVREILTNVVDSVETESARRQRPGLAQAPSENRWKTGPPVPGAPKQVLTTDLTRPTTLRDVVMGNGGGLPARASNAIAASSHSNSDVKKGTNCAENEKQNSGTGDSVKRRQTVNEAQKMAVPTEVQKKGDLPKSIKRKADFAAGNHEVTPATEPKPLPKSTNLSSESTTRQGSTKWSKSKSIVVADQNTAPTYQETVSAMSGTSNNRMSDRAASNVNLVEPSSKSDSSSGDTDEAPQNLEREVSPVEKETSSGPPLLTFVSPENVNSATSSVASSLEVPHAGRRHHHSASTPDTTDVGYHLLDVCDRLSRDMGLFMNSREQAINVRRRERGAVLSALQDTLSSLWPGMCRPEMYGSCATLLDLPSSDLDVVVVGLDHSEMMLAANQMAVSHQQQHKNKRAHSNDSRRRTHSADGSAANQNGRTVHSLRVPPPSSVHSPHMHPGAYLPLYRNSERVKQLAQRIEGQPWAVQVKSLPNATVPVIKILADPSKLSGTGTGVEWPCPGVDTTDSRVDGVSKAMASGDSSIASGHPQSTQNLYEPWRGSDVMNGLISLDITFEGPEHGGIGSTDFSVHVVSEFCQELNAPPESIPFVQCLMVLKELLVQRKLNEPYSGGLSSYALLLLLLALVRERALIREEIERVERQRKAMVEGGVTTYAGALSGVSVSPDTTVDTEPTEISEGAPASLKSTRSWANIAKKPNHTPTPSVSSEQPDKKVYETGTGKTTLHRPVSFDDAIGRPSENFKGKSSHRSGVLAPAKQVSETQEDTLRSVTGEQTPARLSQKVAVDPNNLAMPSFYPQGFDDVIEVLCAGETTAGKLLMHFLLYYGQYFDAQATAIDVSGKHERVFLGQNYSPYSYLSPYIPRRAPEAIDHHTGMLVVDHIVIYDPLEGAENNNVARRCFAWQQVKWIFAQSYATLSSAVERSATPPATPSGRPAAQEGPEREIGHHTAGGDLMDPSSPLLRCLLSF